MRDHREIEEERRVTRDEAAELLIEVGERLRRDGVVAIGGEELPVPDDLELEVEYEEEPGEAEFEVELEWRPREARETLGVGEEDGSPVASSREETRPPFDDVKGGMDEELEEMRRAVEVRRELPGRAVLDRFLELNDAFERYAEDEPYGDRMGEYSGEVRRMAEAYGAGDLERFRGHLEQVRVLTDSCHADFG